MSDQTWGDLVRSVAAEYGVTDLSDADVDNVLWEQTPFPLATRDLVEPALHEFFAEVTGGD